ncbi:hypothetical protein SAMN04488054_12316 [Salibacterium qingdaonense]|uniref:Uncharacterized protein n=1 Tax=Salibacterium qingdaonense TaxID=266892 RepID=A0A1I4P5H2_9BACI|nr:hypothetical protein SAMN04488054_12316 [Salibacterium qingdaonense]
MLEDLMLRLYHAIDGADFTAGWTVYPRHFGMQYRFILPEIQMAPCSILIQNIMNGTMMMTTIWTGKARSAGISNINVQRLFFLC